MKFDKKTKPAYNNRNFYATFHKNRKTYFEIEPVLKKALRSQAMISWEYQDENPNDTYNEIDSKHGTDATAVTGIGLTNLAMRIQDRRDTHLPIYDAFTISDKQPDKEDYEHGHEWTCDILKYLNYDMFYIPRKSPDLIVHVEIKGDEMRVWKVLYKTLSPVLKREYFDNNLDPYKVCNKKGEFMEFYKFDMFFMRQNDLWGTYETEVGTLRKGQYESWSLSKGTMNWYIDERGNKVNNR